MPNAKKRQLELLVIDDHAIVRQGVKLLVERLPEVRRCRAASHLAEAMQLLVESPADVAIVDLSLKGENGLDAITELLRCWPTMRVVVLSMHADRIHCQRALNRGAKAFVAKEDANDELCHAILGDDNETFLSATVKSANIGRPGTGASVDAHGVAIATTELTPREQQILALIGKGRTVNEIAAELGRSAKTVEAHRNNLREKLGLRTSQQLLQFSAKWMQFDSSD
jgi:two-component system, NarL family, response regulator NreC